MPDYFSYDKPVGPGLFATAVEAARFHAAYRELQAACLARGRIPPSREAVLDRARRHPTKTARDVIDDVLREAVR